MDTQDTSCAPDSVAVLIPCYNEGLTIASVVRDFLRELPHARVYVYDNNSTDNTRAAARAGGATVACESRQGKGNVVRRMFSDIDADVYVLVDGDETYDAASATELIAALAENHMAMVVGRRVHHSASAYRRGHVMGNALLQRLVGFLFGHSINDLLSGYRVFSRQFVKSFPALSSGFEIEAELTVHALSLQLPVQEIDTPYGERPAGSASKLQTYRDGFRILGMIVNLLKNERPMLFFGVLAAILEIAALALIYPIFVTYVETGLVPRFPTAILTTGIGLLGFIGLTCGLVLDTVTRGRREAKYLAWLAAGERISQVRRLVRARVSPAAVGAR
ncbi:MAG: glycosyltransferase family 2 protein [Bryobacteraceae bacterium]